MNYKNDLLEKLPSYLNRIRQNLSLSESQAELDHDLLETYLAESRIGLELIAPYLRSGQRVLEVGSGIGALGHFLSENGIDIYGLEPSGTGFGVMTRLAAQIDEAAAESSSFSPSDKSCTALDPDVDGLYNLIFSVHVMEHVEQPAQAFAAMERVLAPDGIMLHLCPNYRFPYDPHFSALIPFYSPAFAKRIYARRISKAPALWDSLNFIGARDFKKLAKSNELSLSFVPGVMADTFQRLIHDEMFKKRHNGIAARLARGLAGSPLNALLKRAPATWTSPMVGIFTKQKP